MEKKVWLGTSHRLLGPICVLIGLLGCPLATVGQPPVASTVASMSSIPPQIDEALRQYWQSTGLKAASDATDAEWCRRLFLDVLGRIPGIDELQGFLNDRSRDKREALVRSLLYDESYQADYVDQWSTIWTNILLGRSGGLSNDSLADREGMTEYLKECFSQNRSYAKMAEQLITATGTNQPGTPGFNGAVNFLCDKLADDATQATARTAQIFLGVRLQCTQCHNHPFNEWKQERFWQLNSFFRQAVPLRRFRPGTNRIAFVELADQDFAGEGTTPAEAEVYFEQRDGILKVAYPVFIDGQPLENRSGYVEDVRRRESLAAFVTSSPNLAEAVANRYWSHFLGFGLVEPIDDFGPHREVNLPQVLQLLANGLREDQYDLKSLISWIVLSKPYALTSRIGSRNPRDHPPAGSPPGFSRFYVRQQSPESVYRSMLVLSYAERKAENELRHRPTRREFLGQFTQAIADDEGNETTTFNGTIPQTLMMFNGPLLDSVMRLEAGSMLAKLASDNAMTFDQKVSQLYGATIARSPTKRELRAAREIQATRAAQRQSKGQSPSAKNWTPQAAALQDVVWALLNSNEFILNH